MVFADGPAQKARTKAVDRRAARGLPGGPPRCGDRERVDARGRLLLLSSYDAFFSTSARSLSVSAAPLDWAAFNVSGPVAS